MTKLCSRQNLSFKIIFTATIFGIGYCIEKFIVKSVRIKYIDINGFWIKYNDFSFPEIHHYVSLMYNDSNGKDGSRKRLVLLGGDIDECFGSFHQTEWYVWSTYFCSFLFYYVWCMFIFIGAQLRYERGTSFEFDLENKYCVCCLVTILWNKLLIKR